MTAELDGGAQVPRTILFALLLLAQSCITPVTRDYPDFIVAGEQANALLCRPEGQGLFPVVVWSHGRVTDPAAFARARQGGWKRLCEALASDGFLAFVPICDFERGGGPHNIPYDQEELSRAVDYVKGLPADSSAGR
jgi:dienelactone hydrolase